MRRLQFFSIISRIDRSSDAAEFFYQGIRSDHPDPIIELQQPADHGRRDRRADAGGERMIRDLRDQ